MNKMSPEELLRFARNDRQVEVIQAVINHGSNNKAAKALGCARRTVDTMLKRLEAKAASKAVAPHKSVNRETMEGFEAKRVSTAYKEDGTVALQWVIQEPEKRSMKQKLDAMLEGMQDDLTGFKDPVKAPKKVNSDYLAMYMMGDHHFGMLADGETKMSGDDADWDVKIATSILLDSTNRLASRVGDAEIGVLLNCGDFFHADSSANTTTKGTPVDVDTRIAKTFKLAGRLFQTLINKMLETHKKVVVINVRGNHDSDMACHLSSCIELLYAKEKRVDVLQNYSKFIHYQWHNNLFVFHHGDRMKHEQILQAVIRNLDDEWSQSKNRYCHLGHIHHHTAREVGSMHFEHWGSLTATDSWHSSEGYGAERSMTAVVYHKDTGEDSRVKIKVG
jgi:predicted phosphodiesterase